MAHQATTGDVIKSLARTARVITLGGGAVIAHGHSRNTHDADIWLEPLGSSASWCDLVRGILNAFPSVGILSIGGWQQVSPDDFPDVIEEDGVVRLAGLERPLDIFRRPNELEVSSFEEVWARASVLEDGTRLPDAVDLLVTKQLTGRAKDQMDILFLEQKAEVESLARLDTASPAEICELLERFLTPNLAAAAARHADPGVRELALRYLKELADEGDPFAADLLRGL